jgi:hypothetical protein
MRKIVLSVCLAAMATNLFAYNWSSVLKMGKDKNTKAGVAYLTAEEDGMLFSWASGSGYTSNLRFSMFINTGFRYNYNLTKNVALYTGVGIKNVGTSDRYIPFVGTNKIVSRARSYFVGAPIGVRIGNFKKNTEVILGGGVDITANYQVKSWTEGSKHSTKVKDNWWFDDTYTNLVNPYIFAGFKVKGVGLKYQFYTTNNLKNGNTNLQFISLILNNNQSTMKKNVKTKKIKKSINSI